MCFVFGQEYKIPTGWRWGENFCLEYSFLFSHALQPNKKEYNIKVFPSAHKSGFRSYVNHVWQRNPCQNQKGDTGIQGSLSPLLCLTRSPRTLRSPKQYSPSGAHKGSLQHQLLLHFSVVPSSAASKVVIINCNNNNNNNYKGPSHCA